MGFIWFDLPSISNSPKQPALPSWGPKLFGPKRVIGPVYIHAWPHSSLTRTKTENTQKHIKRAGSLSRALFHP